MNKKQMRNLLEFVKIELENIISGSDASTADELYFWTEITRFCSHEAASIAFDQAYDEKVEGK